MILKIFSIISIIFLLHTWTFNENSPEIQENSGDKHTSNQENILLKTPLKLIDPGLSFKKNRKIALRIRNHTALQKKF